MRILTAILALAASVAGAAENDHESLYRERPGGAEVYYAAHTTVVDVAGFERDLDSARFMLDYAEAANDWLYLGFSIGMTFDNMQAEPLVTDADPTGYGFGVFAGARFLEVGPFAVLLEARHNSIDGAGTGSAQESTLTYTETIGRLGATYRWQAVELAAGAFTLAVDGEVESTGGVVGTADFEAVESSGAWGSLRLRIDGGYALGLRFESGARETLAFTFSTRF